MGKNPKNKKTNAVPKTTATQQNVSSSTSPGPDAPSDNVNDIQKLQEEQQQPPSPKSQHDTQDILGLDNNNNNDQDALDASSTTTSDQERNLFTPSNEPTQDNDLLFTTPSSSTHNQHQNDQSLIDTVVVHEVVDTVPQGSQDSGPIIDNNNITTENHTNSNNNNNNNNNHNNNNNNNNNNPKITNLFDVNDSDDEEEVDLTCFEETGLETAQAVLAPRPGERVPSSVGVSNQSINGNGEDGENKKDEEEKLPPVSCGTLFRFATAFDFFLVFLGMLGALGNGFMLPLSSLLMGEALNKMQDDFQQVINDICFIFFGIGIISMICGVFQTFCFTLSSERQGKKLRETYLKALFRQDMTFHDLQIANKDVASKITEYTTTVQNGLADKLGAIVSAFSSFIFALVLAFTKGWELSLVLLAPLPFLFIVIAIVMSRIASIKVEEQKAYAKANILSTESFDNIQTVKVYNMTEGLIQRYKTYLIDAYKLGKKSAYTTGVAFMTFLTLMFSMYALGIWYGGVRLLARHKHTFGPDSQLYNGGLIIAIFYVLLSAMQSVGSSMQNLTAVSSARASMAQLITVIDRQSEIDPYDFSDHFRLQRKEWIKADRLAAKKGIHSTNIKHVFDPSRHNKYLVTRLNFTGSIKFENVTFTYPSRPTQPVLKNFSFEFEGGKSYGCVGSSGCGKSTIIQLIQRFYDPDSGNIFIQIFDKINPADSSPDASRPIIGVTPTKWVNLRDVYIGPFRKYCLGLVTQEPPLIPGTIADNIRFGSPHSTTEEIVTAALLSHSHDFIMKKADHYNYYLSAGSLSGGESQRIAIARVLLMKPAALLLDEFTSAFDYKTEAVVTRNLSTMQNLGLFGRDNSHSTNSDATIDSNDIDATLHATNNYDSNQVGSNHVKLVITIAHRLITVRNSLILGMQDGNIVEFGTHDQLLSQHPNGVYAQMYNAHPDPSLTGAFSPTSPGANTDFTTVIDTHDEQHGNKSIQPSNNNNNNNNNNNKTMNKFALKAKEIISTSNIRIRPSNFISSTDKHLQEQKQHTKVNRATRKFQFSRLVKHIFVKHPFMMFLALVSITIGGASFPGFSYIFGHALKALYEPNVEDLKKEVKRYALYFIVFALGAGFNTFFSNALLGVVSEKVIAFFRAELFNNIIKQEMGFFDQETNSTGILTTKLAKDTTQIRNFMVQFFQQCLSFIAQLGITIGMAYHTSPRMTLIMCLIFPLTALSSYLHFKFVRGFAGTTKEHLENAGLIAVSAMKNLRVIASFNCENWTWVQFSQLNDDALWTGMISGLYGGFGFGLSQFCFYLSSSLIYYFGGHQVIDGNLTFNDFFQVSQSMRFASQQFSMILGQMSSLDAMNAAISDMYDLMDRKSLEDAYLLDNCMTSDEALDAKKQGKRFQPISKGHIEFKNVKFHYPTNRKLPILRGISFHTHNNNKNTNNDNKNNDSYLLALVGASGNGKSTIMNLLLHYYDTVQENGNPRLIIHKKAEYLKKFMNISNKSNNNYSYTSTTIDKKGNRDDDMKQSLLSNVDSNDDDDAISFLGTNNKTSVEGTNINGSENDSIAISIDLPGENNNDYDSNAKTTEVKVEDMTPQERREYTKKKIHDFEFGGDFRSPDQSGHIYIDGRDIMTIPLKELYKYISIVPQQPQIFNLSVLDNVRCSDTTITLDECISACKKAQIHDIITKLPQQYDTIIDTKKLSTGQKQRLAIARALIKNPVILCLDEASSGLDAINSKKVHLALEEAMKGKVTISIAHRLETIANADNILVLDRGVIVENGTHNELLQYSQDRLAQGKPQGVYATFLDSSISQ